MEGSFDPASGLAEERAQTSPLVSRCVLADVAGGTEEWPIPLHTVEQAHAPPPTASPDAEVDCEVGASCAALASIGRFTYAPRNLNRTIVTVEGALLSALLQRTAPRGLLTQRQIAEHLRPCHGEQDYLLHNRRQRALQLAEEEEQRAEGAHKGAAAGAEATTAAESGIGAADHSLVDSAPSDAAPSAVAPAESFPAESFPTESLPDELLAAESRPAESLPTVASAGDDHGGGVARALGCGKCRWSPVGCGRCRAAGFVPGPKEGRAGGIPQPGSEASLVVVGEPGDGGGLLVDVIVTDDTPICRALRAAGLPAGVGLVAREPLRTGEAVVEYVGEVLTREQAEAREAWYQQQGYQCSYPLFTEQHGYVIDATLYGNAARFMNGSCEPNLKPQRMAHAQQEIPRVLFRALRDIAAGEELTWRYHAAAGSAVSSAPATNEYARVARAYGGGRRAQHQQGHGALQRAFGFSEHRCFCGSRKCTGRL